MHDYVRGAFQALTWIRELMNSLENEKEPNAFEKLIKEVDDALNDIEHGAAIDFRWRIKTR